ncbi:MAG: benzoyl-CoA reductase subunit C [Candidatus Krumholzibacteria bacterium]|nr:benzoyl-CoA reductase subunit C [Candidatus Krumholzibacteria bacterium]
MIERSFYSIGETVPDKIARDCEELFLDFDFDYVHKWKEAEKGRRVMGYLPIYIPRPLIHGAGFLPVGVMGGGDRVEIIKGDAYFQSYICHLPRSFVELAIEGKFADFDGFLFPSICDVIRNLSGMWKMLFPDVYAKYLDLPQNFDPSLGGSFYRRELEKLLRDLEEISGKKVSSEDLLKSIRLYNRNAEAIEELDRLRREKPWEYPASEVYAVVRAGMVLEVGEHTEMIGRYRRAVEEAHRPFKDGSRVVVSGAFCEQPPPDLIRSLELAGCMIVADDFLLGSRWHTGPLPEEGDPLDILSDAYLSLSTYSSSRYDPLCDKRAHLIQEVRNCGADGVIHCAPSFCDPSLLDLPLIQEALDKAKIPSAHFKYAENTGQFQAIREQAGTFADSLMLWSEK